jgi:non-specific serine/threonine protein kinase
VAGTFPHGAWFVDLAPTTNPDLVPGTVARVLDVPEKPGATMMETLIEWLRDRQILLILDNCEHLVDACAAFAESVLRHASSLRMLATSREALSVPGEAVWRVPPLAFPSASDAHDPDALLAFDAVRLFADRASAVTSFQLTSESAAAVADICRRLDGVPLAIELAAARAKLLSVHQIRERLDDRFRLLAGGGRTAVARQRTLEATVDWSYELLPDVERRLLNRLSVFSDGWTIDAAEQVCGDRGLDRGDVLDLLSRLVDKSLVVVDDGAVERRYRLLETIRQYGRDKLVDSGEAADIGHAHFDYFLALARRAEPKLIGTDQVAWLNVLDAEHGNLRTAIDWSLGEPERRADGLALCVGLWWFWAKRGYFREGQERLVRALAEQADVSVGVEARVLVGLVHLATFGGDFEAAVAFVARARDASRAAGDGWAEAYAIDFAAILEAEAGRDPAQWRGLAQSAREIAQRSESPLAWQPFALATRLVGYDALQSGRLDDASECFEASIAPLRRHGDLWSMGILLTDLAGLRVLQGRHDEARSCATEALSCCRSIRDRRGVGWCLQTMAMLEAAVGRARRAAWLYGAGQTVLDSIGAAGQMHVTRVQEHYLAPARQTLGDAAFAAIASEGRATPVARIMEPGATDLTISLSR